jgi:hypothetical protein
VVLVVRSQTLLQRKVLMVLILFLILLHQQVAAVAVAIT